MAGMFGCLVSGRLVQTDCQMVSENQLVFNILDCDSVNHIVIFLTGTQPFPDGFGGSVYFCWPKPQPTWSLLGFISNEKPSAIFKIAKVKSAEGIQTPFNAFMAQQNTTIAQVGISVEPLTQIAQQTPASDTTPSKVGSFVEFSQKMLQNCFNYCSSFAQTQVQMTPNPNETFVPLSALQQWYSNFERRMAMDPNYWKS